MAGAFVDLLAGLEIAELGCDVEDAVFLGGVSTSEWV